MWSNKEADFFSEINKSSLSLEWAQCVIRYMFALILVC